MLTSTGVTLGTTNQPMINITKKFFQRNLENVHCYGYGFNFNSTIVFPSSSAFPHFENTTISPSFPLSQTQTPHAPQIPTDQHLIPCIETNPLHNIGSSPLHISLLSSTARNVTTNYSDPHFTFSTTPPVTEKEKEKEDDTKDTLPPLDYFENDTDFPNFIKWYLAGGAALVMGIIVFGGVTRLTESGLSITDWKPQGRKFPSNEKEWVIEFEKYKKSPEFQKVHSFFNIEDFKNIFWYEYWHRMYGRFIGAYFAIPTALLIGTRMVRGRLQQRLLAGCGLVGLQGLLGWYMVKSGLEHENFPDQSDTPRVSHFRLASHLAVAIGIFMLNFRTFLHFARPKSARPLFLRQTSDSSAYSFLEESVAKSVKNLRTKGMGMQHILLTTAFFGALTAGTDAGFMYNTWPLFIDDFFPEEFHNYSWSELVPAAFNDPAIIQLTHRDFAYLSLLYAGVIALTLKKSYTNILYPQIPKLQIKSTATMAPTMDLLPKEVQQVVTPVFNQEKQVNGILKCQAKRSAQVTALLVVAQATLGIGALVMHVPVYMGALHQGCAIATIASANWMHHEFSDNLVIPTPVEDAFDGKNEPDPEKNQPDSE